MKKNKSSGGNFWITMVLIVAAAVIGIIFGLIVSSDINKTHKQQKEKNTMKESKLIMMELDKNPPKGCGATLVGILSNGDEVKALTDGMGPQIVIHGEKTHLISPRLKSHQDAISRGKVIIAADRIDVYNNWTDLNKESVGGALVRMAFGAVATHASSQQQQQSAS